MKIALVLERFDPGKGGLEHWTWQFAKKLMAAGHEAHVLAFEFSDSVPDPAPVFHRLRRPESRLRQAALFEAKLRALQCDVIHDMGCGWHADIFHPHGGSTLALWEHNLMRIPRWRQFRLWREKRYRETAEIERRQHACREALIVAVSRMVQGHFHRLHGIPDERLRLIYNGVDTDFFSPAHRGKWREPLRLALGCGEDDTLFLLVAHNLLLKNADTTIRALARLVKAGASARLAIVGGKKPKRFIRLAHNLGIAHRIAFVPATGDVRPHYAAADAYVHPTWYDPCSLVALEALASGIPVITSRFNGVSEIMTDGGQGFILPHPSDTATLALQMAALLNPADRKRMGEAARELALRHTFDEQAARFIDLYAGIARRKSGL